MIDYKQAVSGEQRAACARLQADLQLELNALPKQAKWHERIAYNNAIDWLDSVIQHGAYGCQLCFTKHPVVLRLAAHHGVPVAPAPRHATTDDVRRLREGIALTERVRPNLRA